MLTWRLRDSIVNALMFIFLSIYFNTMEHRCCLEVQNVQGKLVFDGSIERLACVTEHKDYKAVTNRAVLENVAPLLKGKSGRTYERRAGVTQNE